MRACVEKQRPNIARRARKRQKFERLESARHIQQAGELRLHVLKDSGCFRRVDQIVHLIGVHLQVVELVHALEVRVLNVLVALGAHRLVPHAEHAGEFRRPPRTRCVP